MLRFLTMLLGLASELCFVLPATAEDIHLKIKLGLWEMRSVIQFTMPPIPEGVSPEQRARYEAALKAETQQTSQPSTVKVCMANYRVENFFGPVQPSCQRSVGTNTTTVLELHEQCTAPVQGNMTDHVEATSSEVITGKVHATGSGVTYDRTLQGHWISSDCGTIRP